MKQQYLFDTSIFINGWRKHYQPDVFQIHWDTIDNLIEQEVVLSCEAVYEEVQAQADDLAQWAKVRKSIFQKPDEDTIFEIQQLMHQYPNFAAQAGAMNAADPWVIAHAIRNDAIVVTDEQYSERQKQTKPPKIPNVCEELGMRWMGPVDFLRANRVSYT